MTVTATIRQRGQLTIPDRIREKFSWLKENTVVSIIASPAGEIVIKPFNSHISSDQPDWDEIWRKIKLVRSFKGSRGNLSKFIAEDRYRH
ncbi:AbrB/MazE/SpoVT family DNA-binding domain-containing protein [Candidatus Gottesmanbacteria bacterium]|nr:AbrB/MazE/SpoVT family DNA-binding domain-containing protein [Candidatus Gottesmanbacteria bacterium]